MPDIRLNASKSDVSALLILLDAIHDNAPCTVSVEGTRTEVQFEGRMSEAEKVPHDEVHITNVRSGGMMDVLQSTLDILTRLNPHQDVQMFRDGQEVEPSPMGGSVRDIKARLLGLSGTIARAFNLGKVPTDNPQEILSTIENYLCAIGTLVDRAGMDEAVAPDTLVDQLLDGIPSLRLDDEERSVVRQVSEMMLEMRQKVRQAKQQLPEDLSERDRSILSAAMEAMS